MSTGRLLGDSIARIATDLCTPAVVRRDEAGQPAQELLQAIAAASLDRATSPESAGGGGLGWREVLPLAQAVGEYAMPAPLAESLAAHAIAASAGIALPEGAASFALLRREGGGTVFADAVPWGDRVTTVLGVLPDGTLQVLGAAESDSRHLRNQAGEVRSTMRWRVAAAGGSPGAVRGGQAMRLPDSRRVAEAGGSPGAVPVDRVVALGAALRAAQLAGAMRTALGMTVRYAGERVQFGRPIGRFQAVQQQLAYMAELVAQASIAAELAFDCEELLVDPVRAACAKQVASANALQCASIAHAVHGAIGITAEHDLHLFTRRLRAWAGEWGGAHHWSLALGRGLLESRHTSLWHAVIEASSGSWRGEYAISSLPGT